VAEPDDPGFPKFRGTRLGQAEDVKNFAVNLFPALRLDADREHFVLLSLNNKHRLNGVKVVSTGSLTASLVHPREVYHAAVVLRAAAVIFLHNHPSGNPAPSPEDIDITKRLKQVGDILGIRVLDHIVIGSEGYFSFSDKGML
jgi:DNA repair protein RadC